MSFGVLASSPVASEDSPFAASILADSPLLYLPLNDTTGTTALDLSGNSRHGFYSGNVHRNEYALTGGSRSQSVRVEGDGAGVTVPYAGWMDVDEFTMLIPCFAFGGIRMLASRYQNDSDLTQDSWFIDIGGGNSFVFWYRASDGTNITVDSGVVPTQGTRYFVAVYKNAIEAGIRVYGDDGVLLGSGTGVSMPVNVSTSNLMLFRCQDPNAYSLIGYIDDFTMFGTALATSRIDELASTAMVLQRTWTTKTEGTGARNGTTEHTLTFSQPAAGALLVAVVAGCLTSDALTAGWTKQASSIDNCELAIFTHEADGSETTFTVTHNNSNYPIEWVIYEFPPGSHYLAATVRSSGVLPTLTGLPGDRTTVMIAGCRRLTPGDPPLWSEWWYFWGNELRRNSVSDGVTNGVFMDVNYFKYTDFPDITADITYPANQYLTTNTVEQVLFAIQHP